MRGNAVRVLRWVIVGFGLLAGVTLLMIGATVIGAVILIFAVLRLTMLVAMQRRWRRGGTRSGQMLQRLARNELAVAATAIGIGSDELQRAVDDGRTIASVAADAGIPSRQVVDAVVRDANARVDRAVEAGNVAPNRARFVRNRLPHWAEHYVRSTPAMLAGARWRG
jgi:hypothetical protein